MIAGRSLLQQSLRHFVGFSNRNKSVIFLLCFEWILVVLPIRALEDDQPPDRPLALVLQGQVLDAQTRKPIAGAAVTVHRLLAGVEPSQVPPWVFDSTLKTDPRGRFKVVFASQQIAELRLHVAVEVSHPGYVGQKSNFVSLTELDHLRRLGDRPTVGTIALERGTERTIRVLTPEGQPAVEIPFEYSTNGQSEDRGEFSFLPAPVRGRTDAGGLLKMRFSPQFNRSTWRSLRIVWLRSGCTGSLVKMVS